MASIIRGETVRQQGEYHGGHIIAERRVLAHSNEAGLRGGLLATAGVGGVFSTGFARVDAEDEARAFGNRVGSRPIPVPENRMAPPEERMDRGPDLPGTKFRHQLFKQSLRESAVAVTR
jgi:hypothetical protein